MTQVHEVQISLVTPTDSLPTGKILKHFGTKCQQYGSDTCSASSASKQRSFLAARWLDHRKTLWRRLPEVVLSASHANAPKDKCPQRILQGTDQNLPQGSGQLPRVAPSPSACRASKSHKPGKSGGFQPREPSGFFASLGSKKSVANSKWVAGFLLSAPAFFSVCLDHSNKGLSTRPRTSVVVCCQNLGILRWGLFTPG